MHKPAYNSRIDNDFSILVCSCDEYSDVWPPFFAFFRKHWPECPWPLHMMTNQKEFDFPSLSIVKVGFAPWGERFLKAIEQVGGKYILILMEDYFLLEKPDEDFLRQAVAFMREQRASYLRLFPRPGPDRITGTLEGIEIGEIDKHSDYRVSLQASIWDVDYLKRLTRREDSTWDFEIEGTRRSNQMDDKLYSVSDRGRFPISYYCTAVVKGLWRKEAVRLCRKNHVPVDTSGRGMEPFYLRWNIKPIIEMIEIKNDLKRRIARTFH